MCYHPSELICVLSPSPFPFSKEIPTPGFPAREDVTLDSLRCYVHLWSPILCWKKAAGERVEQEVASDYLLGWPCSSAL